MELSLGSDVIEDSDLFYEIYDAYRRGEPVYVVLPSGRYRVVGIEPWESDCLLDYADRAGIEIPPGLSEDEIEDFLWDLLPDAIRWAMRTDGYDNYIYVDPYACGVAYGCTIWLKRVTHV